MDIVEFLNARYDQAEKVIRPTVLVDIEAKRRIVELHSGWHVCWTHTEWDPPDEQGSYAAGGDMPPCDTLRLLALPYADHPDLPAVRGLHGRRDASALLTY